MDPQTLINIAFALCSSVTGWFAKELWDAVKELKVDLAKLREALPKTYVVKDDYREDIRELKELINKIFDKLDSKTDKQ
jgi:cell division protein FtsB